MGIDGRKRELIARLKSVNGIHRKHIVHEDDAGIEAKDDDDNEDDY